MKTVVLGIGFGLAAITAGVEVAPGLAVPEDVALVVDVPAELVPPVVFAVPETAPGVAVVGVETPISVDPGEFASGVAVLPELVPTVEPAVGELAEVVPEPDVLGLLLAAPALGCVAMLPEFVAEGFCGVCAEVGDVIRHTPAAKQKTSKATGTDLLIIRTPETSEMQQSGFPVSDGAPVLLNTDN